ncbi:MAG: DUF4625 domain-containing protein [Flavobacteriales bacterium]
MRKGTFFIVLILLSMQACKKQQPEDQLPPEISLLSIAPAITSDSVCGTISQDVIPLAYNEIMTLRILFTDDVALSQAKFDIHHNFDCHGHKSQKSGTVWNQIEIFPLTGKSKELEISFTPPENVVPGNYHFGIMAVDAEGRLSHPLYFDLKIFDPIDTQAPVISLNRPEANQQINLGSPMLFEGNVSDDTSMDLGEIEISIISPTGISFSVQRIDIPSGSGANFDFSFSYNIPTFFVAGDYTISIIAKDWRNNETLLLRMIRLIA